MMFLPVFVALLADKVFEIDVFLGRFIPNYDIALSTIARQSTRPGCCSLGAGNAFVVLLPMAAIYASIIVYYLFARAGQHAVGIGACRKRLVIASRDDISPGELVAKLGEFRLLILLKSTGDFFGIAVIVF